MRSSTMKGLHRGWVTIGMWVLVAAATAIPAQAQSQHQAVANYIRDNVLGPEAFSQVTLWMTPTALDDTHVAFEPSQGERELIPFPYPLSWLVMIDDAPDANWGHGCRYLFVNADLDEHTEPTDHQLPAVILADFGSGPKVEFRCRGVTPIACPSLGDIPPPPGHTAAPLGAGDLDCLYAVLVSGGIDEDSNYSRYPQNIRSMYNILRNCGYPASQIWVYYADGSAITGVPVDGAADKTLIRNRMQALSATLSVATDVLLFYGSNHGADNWGLCLWDMDGDGLDNDEVYTPAELAADTANARVCHFYQIHDQCFSGEFLPMTMDGNHDNTVVYAAATADEVSWGREYMAAWETQDPGTNTMNQMHQYVVDNGNLTSTPVMAEGTAGIGDTFLCQCCTNEPPVALCEDITVAVDDNCCVTVTVTDIDDGSYDPNGDLDIQSLCITAVDGNPVGCVQSVQFCSQLGTHTVTLTITDFAGESSSCDATVDVVDTTPPWAQCPPEQITIECGDDAPLFEPEFSDNCDADLHIACISSIALTGCGGEYTISRSCTATDDSGNATTCSQVVHAIDTTPPDIVCPGDAYFEHGNFYCNDGEVLDWLNSATATDVCDPNDPVITHDAPPCGFAPGSTTVVTWTATDACGNSSQCSATVTIAPLDRGQPGIKGSLLVYPDVEVRWDAAGNLVQDTFLTVNNDFNQDVWIQAYFVSETCTRGDVSFVLTHNQPVYWSAATGLPLAVSPWTALGGSYLDPEGSGELIARGYVVLWATNPNGAEIRWNHLYGTATIVRYPQQTAWEYGAWAYASTCVAHGQEPFDCLFYDANGACCNAAVLPGNIDFDGFHHASTPDQLVMSFLASGSQAYSTGGYAVVHETDLTLLVMDQDLRQDTDGPYTTKAKFDIWNENEVALSGAARCITKWDQFLLGGAHNHFLRAFLQTDAGRLRVDGQASTQCPGSIDTPLIGVVNRMMSVNGTQTLAGTWTWIGGWQFATLKYDAPNMPPPESAGSEPEALNQKPVEPGARLEMTLTPTGR